jgi:prevent-host-death family protein
MRWTPRWTSEALDDSHLNGYVMAMSNYSVAEAKNNLPKLIDRALSGEDVTITRRGEEVVEIVVKRRPARTKFDSAWFRKHQVVPKNQDPEFDSDKLIRRMRDEGY